jgi:hypothetical protein
MSAYIIDRDHLSYLINAALWAGCPCESGLRYNHNGRSYHLRGDDVQAALETANDLWRENIASVSYRYPGETTDTLPGPIGETYKLWPSDICGFPLRDYAPVQVLKALDCYEYQSCEHPAWPTSAACAFVDALRRTTIRRLAGYDAAEWGAPSRKGRAA